MDPTTAFPSPMVAKMPETAGSAAPVGEAEPRISTDPGADAVLEEIRGHLGEGRYRTAQGLAEEAAGRFPEDPRIRTMNRGLNEWTARSRPATGVDRTEEREWMKQDPPESLRGKVVALVGREIAGAADTMAELQDCLRSQDLPKTPLVFRVG